MCICKEIVIKAQWKKVKKTEPRMVWSEITAEF